MLADAVEFVVVGEVDHDFAAAFGGLRDLHFRAQRGAEFLFQRGDLFAAGARDGARLAVFADDGQRFAVGRSLRILH